MVRTADPRCVTGYNSPYLVFPLVKALRRALLYGRCHALLPPRMQLFGALLAWGSRPRPPPTLSRSSSNNPPLNKAKGTFHLAD